MLFLGTGAAELSPNPFSNSGLSRRLRQAGDIPRKRSALLYDETLCLDFGPDVIAASLQYNAPFYNLTDILITHTHEDHLCPENIDVLTMTDRQDRHIRLWLSPEAANWLELYRVCNRPLHRGKCGLDKLIENGWLSINVIEPYRWQNVGDARVFAIRSNHISSGENEFSLNYVIEKNGRRMLYALDTGIYSQENLDALRDFGCDTLVMEATYGSWDVDKEAGHLGASSFILNANNLTACGALKADARIYASHINQCHEFTHDELQSYMNSHSQLDITVACDGMRIE